MLRWRFVSAAAIIFVLLVLGWLDYRHNFDRPGLWLLPLGLFACLTSTVEVLGLLHKQYLQPVQWTVYGGTAGVFLASAGAALWLPFPYDGSMTPSAWSLLQLSWTLLAMVAAAILFLGAVAGMWNPFYLSPRSLTGMMTFAATLALVAYGQQFLMMVSGIDLSVGPTMGLCQVVGSFFLLQEQIS